MISQQSADEPHAAMMQAKATLAQSIALQTYETVTAPFDGIVTARYVDPGHLIPEATTRPARRGAIMIDLADETAARLHLRAAEYRAVHPQRRPRHDHGQ